MADWKHGLFACMDTPAICVKTTCCPCLTVGDISEFVETGGYMKGCLGWYCCMACCYAPICLIDMPNRAKAAEKLGIAKENVAQMGMPPIVVELCCNCCSKIQVAQEIAEKSGAPEQQVTGAPELQVMGAPIEMEMA